MKNRTDLINYLIQLRGLKSYLEIGVCRKHHNFDHIKVENKICVDPDPEAKATFVMTSDEFFKSMKGLLRIDIIFIDGLHHADQVQKDFENALSMLSDNGFIVMHDCNPPSEETTCVPRGKQREWCGDVYKFACRLLEYTGIDFRTINFDYGCCAVWKNKYRVGISIGEDITWQIFLEHKEELLNLISSEKFIKTVR